MSELIFCIECGSLMLRIEWITGDYCWGCRAMLGRNWVDIPHAHLCVGDACRTEGIEDVLGRGGCRD